VADAEIHVDVAGLEIGDGEQRVLLILQRREMTDLPEVAVIFETEVEIPFELMREADGGREGRRTVVTRCNIDDWIDDEFEIGVPHPDDRAQFDAKSRWRKHCRFIAELEIGAVASGTAIWRQCRR
jgi:hypothetical protein